MTTGSRMGSERTGILFTFVALFQYISPAEYARVENSSMRALAGEALAEGLSCHFYCIWRNGFHDLECIKLLDTMLSRL